MTDKHNFDKDINVPSKEIIIDGVDVSGCDCFITQMDFPNNLEGGYYNQNNLCECGVQGVESYSFFCKDNPNCYYKQLKRKEDLINEIEDIIEPYQTEIEAEAFSLPTAIKSIFERKEEECETLASQLDFEVQKKECLEQKLEKIKSYCEEHYKPMEYWQDYEDTESDKYLIECARHNLAHDILQIIEEQIKDV